MEGRKQDHGEAREIKSVEDMGSSTYLAARC